MPDSIINEALREIEPLGADELIGPAALFPGYVGELASAAMVSRTVDGTIERRSQCSDEPIRRYLTTDHVIVEDDYSDTQLAELFLHHRVLIVPIATSGKVHAVVTRHDFFCALVERFGVIAEDLGD